MPFRYRLGPYPIRDDAPIDGLFTIGDPIPLVEDPAHPGLYIMNFPFEEEG